MPPGDQRLAFICGCPASGAAPLAQILNQHPDCAVAIERYSMRYAAKQFEWVHWTATAVSRLQPGDTWYGSLSQFGEFYPQLLRKWDRARCVGDKSSFLFDRLGHLLRNYERPRIVFTLDDPLPIALAYERQRERSPQLPTDWDYKRAVADFNRANRRIVEFWNLLDILVLERSYLATPSEAFGQRLAAFLDVREFSFQPTVAPDTSSAVPPSAEIVDYVAEHVDRDTHEEVRRHARDLVLKRAAMVTVGEAPIVPINLYIGPSDRGITYPHTTFSGRSRYLLRSPLKDLPERYLLAVGSAWTFGRWVEQPYCDLLASEIGIPVVNLGIGGARPETFLKDAFFREVIGAAEGVVFEIMSARGYPSPVFFPNNHHTNVGHTPLRGIPRLFDPYIFVDQAYEAAERLLDDDMNSAIATDLARTYFADYAGLVALRRGKPFMFLAFYSADHLELKLYRRYPHFISRGMWRSFAGVMAADLVEVSGPTPDYYASQSMHRTATEKLLTVFANRPGRWSMTGPAGRPQPTPLSTTADAADA